MKNENHWLARICVVAFLIYLPLQLLKPLVEGKTIKEVLSHPAAGNLIQAVSAIGTMLAAIIALYFGVRSLTKTQSDEADKAALAAARVFGILRGPLHELRALSVGMDFAEDDTQLINTASRLCHAWTKNWPADITDDLLLALKPLPGNCGTRIALASVMLRELTSNYEKFFSRTMMSAEAAQWVRKWQVEVDAALEYLAVAQANCQRAAHLGAPPPTTDELYGDGQ